MHGARGKTGLCVRVLEQGVLIESSKLIEKSMIHDEIDRIRFLAGTDYLRAYAARAETWELLCIIFSLQGDRRYGINEALLRKEGKARISPFPGHTYPLGSVTDMPSAV